MKALALLTLAVLSLAACKKDAPATTTPPDNNGGTDPGTTDPSACTADSDCVAVELECCDACNGGDAVGVHKDHVAAVTADSPRGRGECTDVACTEMACADWIPACDAGTCKLTRGTFD